MGRVNSMKGRMSNNYLPLIRLSPADQELIAAAFDASSHAYASYSCFAVGCSIRTDSGHIYSGANFENASYGLSMCAEVSALAAVHWSGDFPIDAVAVAGQAFLDLSSSGTIVTPCGRCRQLIFEAAQLSSRDIRILCAGSVLNQVLVTSVSLLLPEAFGPENLGVKPKWPELKQQLQRRVAEMLQRAEIAKAGNKDSSKSVHQRAR